MTISEKFFATGGEAKLKQTPGWGYGVSCETCRLMLIVLSNPSLKGARAKATRHDRQFGGNHEVSILATRLPDPDDRDDFFDIGPSPSFGL